jgi:two-component system sensor histidine kinase ChvG
MAAESSERRRPWPRFLSRIGVRLLAFNLLIVFVPAVGFLSLETFEATLLVWQERSMVQQGRLLAAALAERPALDVAAADQLLRNMGRHFDARLRVIDPGYAVVADSARAGGPAISLEPQIEGGEYGGRPMPGPTALRDRPLYRLGNFLYQLYARFFLTADPKLGKSDEGDPLRIATPEVQQALAGSYGSATRLSGSQRSLTLESALPIASGGKVIGAVLVTKSTGQILATLYELRLETFEVVVWSLVAAVALSLFLGGTIARPITRLVAESKALLDRRGRLRGRFAADARRDEVGDLSRALAELTRRLEGHLRFIESFAADVSHELKNPLASIGSASELLEEIEDPEDRKRFVGRIREDVRRLERLISGVREVSRLDADLEALPAESVKLAPLLEGIAKAAGGRRLPLEVELAIEDPALQVKASADRLLQVCENLLDNAASFSPPGATVSLRLRRAGRQAVIEIEDRGPGIPPEHLERIFERFFSYRPGQSDASSHTGLGLAIVKAIVEGYGGRIEARNAGGGGALFEVQLPLV